MNEIVVVNKDELKQLIADAVSEAVKELQPEVWLSAKDAADMFHVSRATIYRLKRMGYITPNTLGRFNKRELEKTLIINGN